MPKLIIFFIFVMFGIASGYPFAARCRRPGHRHAMLQPIVDFFSHQWVVYSLLGIYALTVAADIAVILSENRNPVKSLAWLTVLVLLPVIGPVLYIFFGRNFKNNRMISRRNKRRLKKTVRHTGADPFKEAISADSLRQARMAHNLAGAAFHNRSDVQVFTDGAQKFESLFADIEKATSSVNLQYYIIDDDATGRRLAGLLVKKAAQGVTVRVIYDHVGSLTTPRRYFRRLRKAGVQVHPFFKVSFPPFGTRINWRNHRKIAVIDNRVAYIGGMNIADRYIDGGKFGRWRDTHLRITGNAVAGILNIFATDWSFMGSPLPDTTMPPAATQTGQMCVQALTSGPAGSQSPIAMMFHRAIASAKKRVYIQTPYFLPTDPLLKALQAAALAGCDVRVMMPRHSDSAMLRLASHSYIGECLRAGIKFYFYLPGMLHAKTLIVDDELVSAGSANFDFRSFEHNFEANVFIYSVPFNDTMTRIFLDDQKLCRRIKPETWHRRPKATKAAESLLRLLAPVL